MEPFTLTSSQIDEAVLRVFNQQDLKENVKNQFRDIGYDEGLLELWTDPPDPAQVEKAMRRLAGLILRTHEHHEEDS